jgi:hypothetical protein
VLATRDPANERSQHKSRLDGKRHIVMTLTTMPSAPGQRDRSPVFTRPAFAGLSAFNDKSGRWSESRADPLGPKGTRASGDGGLGQFTSTVNALSRGP